MPAAHHPNTGPALAAAQYNAARRAIDDPAKLARAARIVRVALARQRLTLADLTPLTAPAAPDAKGGGRNAA